MPSRKILLIVLLQLLSSKALADNTFAVTGVASTLGPGLELTKTWQNEGISATLGYYAFDQRASDPSQTVGAATFSGLSYYYVNAENSKSLKLVADWYPIEDSQFRTSAGLIYRAYQAKLKYYTYPAGVSPASARASGWDNILYIITLGGYGKWSNPNDYAHTGAYDIDTSMYSTMPYFGIGYGNPVKKEGHWGVSVDAGTYYTKWAKMNSSATFTCAAGTSVTICNSLQAGTDSAAAALRNDMSDWDWTFALGLSYSF